MKSSLENLKNKIEDLDNNLDGQVNELKEREAIWKKLDEEAKYVKDKQNDIIKLNVSGVHFATRRETLLKVKDTLFYKIIMSKKFDLSKEIFIDRNNQFFGVFMNYLRNGKINYNQFNNEELEDLKIEADYYEFVEIVTYLEDRLKELVIINYTFNGAYNTNQITVGTNKLEDISDRSLLTGICAKTPGWIVFELNYEFEISGVEIGGFTGNTNYWGPTNGQNAHISVSKDNASYTEVGKVPTNFGNSIITYNFNKVCRGKYIKFNHTSFLGFGYCKVIKHIN